MRALALLLVLSAALNGWQHLTHSAALANRDATIAQMQRDANKAALDQAKANERQLADLASQNDQLQAQARATVAGLATALRQRTDKVERLEHENQVLRAWGDTALPADLVRLRQRPAFDSAAALRDWLSASDGLPAAPSQPEDQPRPEPGR